MDGWRPLLSGQTRSAVDVEGVVNPVRLILCDEGFQRYAQTIGDGHSQEINQDTEEGRTDC